MWYDESIIYQIYPLGLCGAPFENGPVCSKEEMQVEHKITKVLDWIPHLKELNVGAIYFSPILAHFTFFTII